MKFFRLHPEEREPDEDSVEGERDLSSINKGISLQNKFTNWAVMGGVCALAAVLLYKYYAGLYDEYRRAEVPSKDITRTVTTTTLPPLTMPDPKPVKLATAVVASEALPPLLPPAGAPGMTSGAPPEPVRVKTTAELVRERRLNPDVRFGLDGGVAGQAGAVRSIENELTGGVPNSTLTNARGFEDKSPSRSSHPESDSGSRAYVLSDPTFIMTRGRTIPCTVIPAIDTSLTGIVTCVTKEDVTGADNSVALMDRGTLCTGKQGGGVVHGQRRVGIIWQRCETPQHVIVPLEAAASDSLGRPGIRGSVDNHFWDRFGAAIALSLITDVGPYLAASRQRGNNNTTVSFPQITGPQEIMSEVLKSTVNIPPTITADHGAQVLIYLAGDIDFRDVYQLERMK